MTATETTWIVTEPMVVLAPDPARLAAVAILSAARVGLAGADIDAAAAAVRRELDVAAAGGTR